MKKIISFLLVFFILSPSIYASSMFYFEEGYGNLYHEGLRLSDLLYAQRTARKAMTTNLELTGCRLHNDYPIPLYLMNDVNPSLIVSPGVPYNLYWFIDCKHIVTHEWIPANYFVILPLEGIRTNAYNSGTNVLSQESLTFFKISTWFNEYENLTDTSMIQYIEHKRGVSLLVRDQDGIVIDAETRWKVQAPSDELATLQDILGDKWYHP